VIPHQTIPSDAQRRLLADAVLIEDLPAFIAPLMNRPPSDLALRQRLAGRSVLIPGARDRGEKSAAVLIDVRHVLGTRQLAVGEVKEVASAGQLAEQVPGGVVGLIVGGIAAPGLEIDRDPAVVGDGEDEQQLLEVGAVVLAVAPGDRQPGLPFACLLVGRVGIVAVEGDRGRVVVQLVEPHAELGDGMSGDGQGKGSGVVLEQAVEAASEAIVIERAELPGGEAEPSGDVPCRPLADAVGRLAGEQQVLEQDEQADGRIDAASPVPGRQIGVQELLAA
jgi:hypothetical protein